MYPFKTTPVSQECNLNKHTDVIHDDVLKCC